MRLEIKIAGKIVPVFGHPLVLKELQRQAEKVPVKKRQKRNIFDSRLRDKRFVA